MWLIAFLLLACVTVGSSYRYGPRFAVGASVAISLLMPVWFMWKPAPNVPLDLRFAVMIFALLLALFDPRRGRLWPNFDLVDGLFIVLIAIQSTSDIRHGGFNALFIFRAYAEWLMPYVAGAWSFSNRADLRRLSTVIAGVVVVLAVWTGIEAMTNVNVANYVVGPRPTGLATIEATRWGMNRAEGPTHHPIFLSGILVLLLPWTVQVAREAWEGTREFGWLFVLPANLAALLFTASRGPWLAVAAAVYFLWILRLDWAKRLWLLGITAAAILLVVLNMSTLYEWTDRLSGEKARPFSHTVIIDGKPTPYSSARHRELMYRVYGAAALRAGWFGYGTELTSSFPLGISVGVHDENSLRLLSSVDNEYLLLAIRLGWLGSLCFAAIVAASVWRGVGAEGSSYEDRMARYLAAAILGIGVMLHTVFLPQDFGLVTMWSMGMLKALRYPLDTLGLRNR